MTIVIDNKESLKHQVIQNLINHHGKAVSMFCAIGLIEDTVGAIAAIESLIEDGLIERKEMGIGHLVLYRYRSELG